MPAQPRPATTFTHLPLPLQSHILSFLCEDNPRGPLNLSQPSQRRPSSKLYLERAKCIKHPLPNNLLAFARASPHFSAAVADLLGPRAKFLSKASTNDQLAEWVAAMAPFVNAVTTYDPKFEKLKHDGLLTHRFPFNTLCRNSLELLTALSQRNINLRLLDLRSTPLDNCKELQQQILTQLVTALEQSSSTLKELALPVTRICARALKRVSLNKLELLKLELRELDGTTNIVRTEIGRSAEAFMKMLRAFEHGTGSHNISRLRELRLSQVHEAPCIDFEPSGCTMAFFSAIKTLRIDVIRSGDHNNDSVAMFISLFPNLERLYWNGAVTQKHLLRINTSCPKLQRLHLRPYTQFNSSFSFSPLPEPDGSAIRDLLLASQGKMKTLMLKGLLRAEHLQVLGENCPNLQHLTIEIGRPNVGGLPLLLGSHCRYIRKLEMPVMSYLWDRLEAQHWRLLTDAITSASDHLTELSIWSEEGSIPLDISVETIVLSIVPVLESLGERARVVRFHLNLRRATCSAVIEGLCRILAACTTRATNLECLEAQFRISSCRYTWNTVEEEEEMLLRLGKVRQKLVEHAPRLRSLSVGHLNRKARKKLEEMKV